MPVSPKPRPSPNEVPKARSISSVSRRSIENGLKISRAYSRAGRLSCQRVARPRDGSCVLAVLPSSSPSHLIVEMRSDEFNGFSRANVKRDTGGYRYNRICGHFDVFRSARDGAARRCEARCPRWRPRASRSKARPAACSPRSSPPTAIRRAVCRAPCAMASRCAPSTCRARCEVIGEVRAGERFAGAVGPGQAVEIMTGAPVPAGADAVVMVEHTRRENGRVAIDRSRRARPVHQSARMRGGAPDEVVLHAGQAPGLYAISPCWRPSGAPRSRCIARPSVAIIRHRRRDRGGRRAPARFPDSQFQRVLAGRAGGARRRRAAHPAGGARHRGAHARRIVKRGLEADLLLLSGGVSAGKYDVVEAACSRSSAPSSSSTAC